MRPASFLLAILAAAGSPSGAAVGEESALVAVASNFRNTAGELATQFEAASGYRVRLSAGSTGKLYAQILNGAPYDLFLAADAERPRRLDETGIGVPGTRRTYAEGRLLLWFHDPSTSGQDCEALLDERLSGRLSIANPELAPYGRAARQYLVATGRWTALQHRLVLGESIAQAFQFVATGNAAAGLVAASQARGEIVPRGCVTPVPASSHDPIEQQLVLLDRGAANPAARAFLEFLGTAPAAGIIRAHGYALPDASP